MQHGGEETGRIGLIVQTLAPQQRQQEPQAGPGGGDAVQVGCAVAGSSGRKKPASVRLSPKKMVLLKVWAWVSTYWAAAGRAVNDNTDARAVQRSLVRMVAGSRSTGLDSPAYGDGFTIS